MVGLNGAQDSAALIGWDDLGDGYGGGDTADSWIVDRKVLL